MITFETSGSFKNTESFLKSMLNRDMFQRLDALGQEGVHALFAATPVNTGRTAISWRYEINMSGPNPSIAFLNDDVENGFPVAVMIQMGHGTGSGGYVAGIDYINPALAPVFDRIAEQVWEAVTSA